MKALIVSFPLFLYEEEVEKLAWVTDPQLRIIKNSNIKLI